MEDIERSVGDPGADGLMIQINVAADSDGESS